MKENKININISSDDTDPVTGEGIFTSTSISTSDPDELFRLLSLAGLSPSSIESFSQNNNDEVVIDDEEIVPEQADYDYGKNPTSRKGHEMPIDPYEYEGTAREPVRYVPARTSDNPLEGKSFFHYLDKILAESENKKLLPPSGTDNNTSHYLKSDTGAKVEFKWDDKRWIMKGGRDRNTPAAMSKTGWKYHSSK